VNTLPEKITSRLYRMTSGVSANFLRFHYQDLSGAITALDAQTGVELLNWKSVFPQSKDSQDLADLFNSHGSDKSGKHNYHEAYASLLRRDAPLDILEIGMGSNDPHFHANMEGTGKPGASIRAFRDWAPNSKVYGADIDQSILFSEDRIQTFFVDQTNPETMKELARKLPKLDLVIDDGFHIPWANLNTINFALPLLKQDGAVVVEDIDSQYIPFWRVAITVLSARYDCQFVQMKSEAIVIVKAARNGHSADCSTKR
jgi:hypothetical protein